MYTGRNATVVKMESDNYDVMEGLFAHYGTSAELQRGELNSDSLDSTDRVQTAWVLLVKPVEKTPQKSPQRT